MQPCLSPRLLALIGPSCTAGGPSRAPPPALPLPAASGRAWLTTPTSRSTSLMSRSKLCLVDHGRHQPPKTTDPRRKATPAPGIAGRCRHRRCKSCCAALFNANGRLARRLADGARVIVIVLLPPPERADMARRPHLHLVPVRLKLPRPTAPRHTSSPTRHGAGWAKNHARGNRLRHTGWPCRSPPTRAGRWPADRSY